MIAHAQNPVMESRRKDSPAWNGRSAFAARAAIGACVGTTVALYGYFAAHSAPAAVHRELHSVALMAAALCLFLTIFLKAQMSVVSSRPHRMKVDGVRKEVFVRRRSEVLTWLVRRWIFFTLCVAASFTLLAVGLVHYQIQIPTKPVQQAIAQVALLGEDLMRLAYALLLGAITMFLAEVCVRLTAKAGLPKQASSIYLPAILSMAATLAHLGGR